MRYRIMKRNGHFCPQLVTNTIALLPGGEWTPAFPGWLFVHLTKGFAYWMNSRKNRELSTGAVLIVPPQSASILRSSQLGEVICHFFLVEPKRLNGLVALGEQRLFEEAAKRENGTVRVLPPDAPIAVDYRRLSQQQGVSRLRTRLQLLDLFVRSLETELKAPQEPQILDSGAKFRLEALLKELPPAELMELHFDDLAAKVGCGPRHFGRVFQQVVGMSFRQKQAEVRLARAQDLLATTNSKVFEVAIESGYESLSLFNLMFKKRFGATPSQWRERAPKARVSA